MVKNKQKAGLISIILILLILLSAVSLPAIYLISDHLSKTTRTRANTLIVEGWLPPYALEMAYNEFISNDYDYVITTGIRISGYFQVYTNGYLIFYTKDMLKGMNLAENHIIEGRLCAF